jgi:hypothetical protein
MWFNGLCVISVPANVHFRYLSVRHPGLGLELKL